jgi:type II secretory pathway pseudopilin PulG
MIFRRYWTGRARRRAGLSLLELLLALAGVALIGAALVAMLGAVTYGTQRQHDLQKLVAQRQAVTERIETAVRNAEAVLEVDEDYIVLWQEDHHDEGEVNEDEVQRIERHDDETLVNYHPEEDDSDGGVLTGPIGLVTETFADDGTLVPELWSRGVPRFDPALDADQPREARLVIYRIRLEADETSTAITSAAALRNRD